MLKNMPGTKSFSLTMNLFLQIFQNISFQLNAQVKMQLPSDPMKILPGWTHHPVTCWAIDDGTCLINN